MLGMSKAGLHCDLVITIFMSVMDMSQSTVVNRAIYTTSEICRLWSVNPAIGGFTMHRPGRQYVGDNRLSRSTLYNVHPPHHSL